MIAPCHEKWVKHPLGTDAGPSCTQKLVLHDPHP
jgi:hypothetical protein